MRSALGMKLLFLNDALVPGGTNYWSHVGIVESVQSAAFLTIEGNSGPSPNAVTRQSRALIGYDFLVV